MIGTRAFLEANLPRGVGGLQPSQQLGASWQPAAGGSLRKALIGTYIDELPGTAIPPPVNASHRPTPTVRPVAALPSGHRAVGRRFCALQQSVTANCPAPKQNACSNETLTQ